MKKRFQLKAFLISSFICLLLWVCQSNAATIYVHSTDGDYADIQSAVVAATVGDTIIVAPGDYSYFDTSKKLHIISEAGPDKTRIIANNQISFRDGADESSISGFSITNSAGQGILIYAGCNLVVINNNIISGCAQNGIYIQTYASKNLSGINIINNTIANNQESGIYFYSYDDGDTATLSNCSINSNIIVNNNNYGLERVYSGTNHSFTNIQFANNCIFNNINGIGSASNVTPLVSDGNIFNNPQFINAETSDYHLQSTSPCIDKGSIAIAYNDPDATRNNIGVYGGPGAVSFWPYPAGGPVVTNLSVTPPSVPVGGTLTLQATGKIQ